MRERELEVFGDQLLDVRSSDVVGVGDFHDFENVNAPKSGTMFSCHILVQRLDSSSTAHLSVFLVHVVGAGS